MACHEIAALRLGMMNAIGLDDESEKQHELDELGPIILQEGPLKSLSQSHNFEQLEKYFEHSLTLLEGKTGSHGRKS